MCMARQCRHLNFDFEFIGRLKTSRRICGRRAGPTKKIHAPFTPERDKEQDEGRRALWEAFEEDAHPPLSDFQTAQSIRFSERRWQKLILDTYSDVISAGDREFFLTRRIQQFLRVRNRQNCDIRFWQFFPQFR